ncbi:hypothetical protein C7S18_23845 (plasmid) [Ahniella affigens]|uniref:Uncharacterized protein n=1 Tax=Ahniella affigens TaxID=2021234 RepID=A0A2P1PZR3_9GAMM|nr:hypothetical protein C7S18_23845 [Ahniella affigens]
MRAVEPFGLAPPRTVAGRQDLQQRLDDWEEGASVELARRMAVTALGRHPHAEQALRLAQHRCGLCRVFELLFLLR